ncbi:MAG: PorV/PorQ family protein [Fidelibacterota bacterium]|nr:MAG: PorV/PorQ family protein [Candidatus Neomarinimicrobiota bacterium]
MKRLTLLLAFAIALQSVVLAQSTASAIFLLIAPGASAGGTGEAQVAAATDAYASYWNPAALAFLPRGEVVYQRAGWLPNLADDMVYNYIGGRYNIPEVGTFGGHVIYLDLGEQEGRDPMNNPTGTFSSSMIAATVSFGTKMSPHSSVGFNAKIIHQNLAEFGAGSEKGKGVSTDFAFDIAYYRQQFLFSRLDLGVAVSNIGPKIAFIDEDQADPAPTNLKLGFKWRMIQTQHNRLSFLYDMNKLLVASYPNIDYDGNGYIGGYDEDGNPSDGGEYGAEGKHEYAHTDPWYLALITSWFDDWRFGGDIDRNGDGIIQSPEDYDDLNGNGQWDADEPYTDANGNDYYDEGEVGNKDDATILDELDTITHNVGLEYWYSTYFAIRAGFIYDKLGKIWNPTFGAGIHYGPYGFDFGYIYGEEGHPLTNTMRFSLNIAF